MRTLSIDPGQTGALALLIQDEHGHRLDFVADMPCLTETLSSGKTRQRVDPVALAEIIRASRADRIIIEKVGPRPGQGTVSMYSFGHSVGLLEGVAAGLGLPVTLITPQAWRKTHRLTTASGKDGARHEAMRRFPDQQRLFRFKKHSGRADAVLIGLAA